jgi:hypothetical protein
MRFFFRLSPDEQLFVLFVVTMLIPVGLYLTDKFR